MLEEVWKYWEISWEICCGKWRGIEYDFHRVKGRAGFPQGVWKGKGLFCGKLGGKCGNVARAADVIW